MKARVMNCRGDYYRGYPKTSAKKTTNWETYRTTVISNIDLIDLGESWGE